MNKSHAKRGGPHSGTLVVFDSNPWNDIIIKVANQFQFSLHTGAIRNISPLGEMNVSLSLSINRLSDNYAIDVIQEVNHVITEDSEMISETNNSSITLTALSRKTHLRVVSLLRPNLISGGSPRRSQWRLREDMSLEIKTDKENKTQLNTNNLKTPTTMTYCWPVDLTLPHQPTTTTNPYLQSSREKDLTVSVSS